MKKARNFKEAAQMALDDRWYLMAKAKTRGEAKDIYYETECTLCELQERRGYLTGYAGKPVCGKCPMDTYAPHTKVPTCSNGWQNWSGSNETNFHEAIMEVVAELEAIAKGRQTNELNNTYRVGSNLIRIDIIIVKGE